MCIYMPIFPVSLRFFKYVVFALLFHHEPASPIASPAGQSPKWIWNYKNDNVCSMTAR